MTEQKKPKIDLKARLGKKSASAAAAPVAAAPVGSTPQAAAPVAQVPSGTGASSPFSSPAAAAPPPEPRVQSIRVELDDEVVATQKRGRSKVLIAAGAAAVAGILLGSVVGNSMAARKSTEISVNGAQSLAKEVGDTNAAAGKLAEQLNAAAKAVKEGKDPKSIVAELGSIHLPFSGASLAGKGIGRFQQTTLTGLLAYAAAAEEVNTLKERLQARLGGTGFKAFLEQRNDPKVSLSVSVHGTPNGPWAVLRPINEPFSVKQSGKWPSNITIKAGSKTAAFSRYTKGDLSRATSPKAIPIDPQSELVLCPNRAAGDVQQLMQSLMVLLNGSQTKPGLLASGQRLADSLKKIGAS